MSESWIWDVATGLLQLRLRTWYLMERWSESMHLQGMIEVARSKNRSNLQFLLKDIKDLDFEQEFDVIFSNAALHWVKDHEGLLRKARRALRDGGKIRFNFAGDGNCSHFFRVVREGMAAEPYYKYFESFEWPWYMPSVAGYRALAERSRLKNIRVWGDNADRSFPDAKTMVDWIDQPSIVPFLSKIAEADKVGFRNLIVGRMMGEAMQEDGRCFETFRRINIFAQK